MKRIRQVIMNSGDMGYFIHILQGLDNACGDRVHQLVQQVFGCIGRPLDVRYNITPILTDIYHVTDYIKIGNWTFLKWTPNHHGSGNIVVQNNKAPIRLTTSEKVEINQMIKDIQELLAEKEELEAQEQKLLFLKYLNEAIDYKNASSNS